VIGKLLENWLDNASERSYQAVFVQMLTAEGYTVLHSTRHCTQEYGKDILAIAPDGAGCAFQLKGDPGKKMNVTQFRTIQAQLVQLMAQRPSYPGFPEGAHRSYLVSNGQYAEEVQFAVHEMNNVGYKSTLELWSRGNLLDLCLKHSSDLWPSEIGDAKSLLEIYMEDPKGMLPLDQLNELLSSILQIGPDFRRLKRAQISRRISSAAWATGICLSKFSEEDNHYAVACGWSLCRSLIEASLHLHQKGNVKIAASEIELCSRASLDALAALWDEVKGLEHFAIGNPMADREIYGWRISVLVGLMSTLAWAASESPLLEVESKANLDKWLSQLAEKPEIWGEGAVAQILPWALYLINNGSMERGCSLLGELTRSICERNKSGSNDALATPHYSYETVIRDRSGLRDGTVMALVDRETFAGSAFTLDPLVKLSVFFGFKGFVQHVWPAFSKIDHRYFEPNSAWQFLLYRAYDGVESTRIYPEAYTWAELVGEAQTACEKEPLLETFSREPWQLFLWWQVSNHRVNVGSLNGIARKIFPDIKSAKSVLEISDGVP